MFTLDCEQSLFFCQEPVCLQLAEHSKSYRKVSQGWGHLITWNGPMMGHLNSFSASGGGTLNKNFPKIQMPGGLPGGGDVEASIWLVHYTRICTTNFGTKISFENNFWVKTSTSTMLYMSFENCRETVWRKPIISAHNWHANHEGIQSQVSSYEKFKLDTCNWTPIWLCIDYVTNRHAENQSQSRILLHIGLYCYLFYL